LSELSLPLREAHTGPVVYVVDTNVFLHDPSALFAFHEHDVVIPMTVIEEIDRFKKDISEVGRNARTFSRAMDKLRSKGSLKNGVPLDGGGTLVVDYASHSPDLSKMITWGEDTNDNRILRTVLKMQRKHAGNVTFITRDTNMRLKCDALGVRAEDYENAHIRIDEQFSGIQERDVPAAMIDALYAEGRAAVDPASVLPHEFVILKADDGSGKSAMARTAPDRESIKLVGRHREGVWGIFARNKEQLFALELLLDDSVNLVTLTGVAGTGKTLVAIAAGLLKVADEKRFRKLLVSRPIFPLGRDIGFLPGDIEQKLNPWMKPVFDNLELLLSQRGEARNEPEYTYLLEQRIIEVEPLTYIRGRSIPGQFLIVDEAQNLTPHEVKTVLTRAGEGTKVVLTGDPNQIDHPYVDALSNGLTYTVERFKGAHLAGHVTLRKGERSELAELATALL
jgi:PhoH-like ATPase